MDELDKFFFPKWMIPSPHYSEDGIYVFQNLSLKDAIKERGADSTKELFMEKMAKMLDSTIAHYKSEKTGAQNQEWYEEMIEFTEEAKRGFESGKAKIVMFYGKYQKNNGLLLTFDKRR